MQPTSELFSLLPLRGRSWTSARNGFLRRSFDPRALRRKFARHPDPRIRTTAAILAAWKEHGKRFRAFLRQVEDVNVEEEARTRLGLHGPVNRLSHVLEQELGRDALPFCWERAIKIVETGNGWKAGIFFSAIRHLADESSVEPLLWAVDEAASASRVDWIHQTLLHLPFKAFRERLESLRQVHTWRKWVMDDLLAR
ncbi:MAG: hypothetical protein AAB074_15035 [Planctomycetota bacterium]